jgi:hypothetical protein
MDAFLQDRYPDPPDGSAEIERERMSREHSGQVSSRHR